MLGIEDACFSSMSVHQLNMFILLGESAVGPRRCWRMGRSSRRGGGRCRRLCGVGWLCVCFWCCVAWLGLLACVLGWYKCASVVGWSVGCGVCVWIAGWAVLGDTAVHLPVGTWGYRTHQTTILLEVFLSFSLSLQGFLYVLFVGFDTTKAWHGRWCWG